MANSNIEWTDKVWNPVVGCNKISQGCKNCYAETMHKRLMFMQPEKYNRLFLEGAFPHEPSLNIPLKWEKPSKIFVNSMSDLFHANIPFEFIDRVFRIMIEAQRHTFMILTKRPKIMLEFAKYYTRRHAEGFGFSKNICLGVSVEDQQTADERIPLLLQTPAAVRFISAEPLIDKIDLTNIQTENYFLNSLNGDHFPRKMLLGRKITDMKLHWVVVGGESGPKARPMYPEWIRKIRDDCKAADIPFFFKQWGEFLPIDQQLTSGVGKYYNDRFTKPGKKKAGRLLDEVEYNEYPKGVRKNAE